MNDPSKKDFKEQLRETLNSSIKSGDFSGFKNLGSTISNMVQQGINTANNQSPPKNSAGSQGTVQPGQSAPSPKMRVQPVWQGGLVPGSEKKHGAPARSYGVGTIAGGIAGLISSGLVSVVFGTGSLVVASAAPLLQGISLFFFAIFGISVGLTVSGFLKWNLAKRVRQYYALLAQKNVCTFEEIAMYFGTTPEHVKKDINKAMKKHMMPDIYIDKQRTCVMLGQENYQLYLNSERSRQERENLEQRRMLELGVSGYTALENFQREGKQTLERIRQANEAIPGQEISKKLDTLESTTAKIFSYVEKHPEKLPDTRRFMDYYLPTTLKIVDKYQQYDKMEMQPQNILQIKQEIEEALDTINQAFTKLLEGLYHEDTLDVSAEIEVLQSMLVQEGLTGTNFDIHLEGDFSNE